MNKLLVHDHTAQDDSDECYWIDGCAIEYGRCDTCGQPCDDIGCVSGREHSISKEV